MKVRLVIIEDEEEERETLASYFSSIDNFSVVATARDGIEGVDAVLRLKPDAVIMDLVMPRLDGYGALRLIRNDGVKTAVVMLSSLPGDRYLKQAMELGADYYMLKPYDHLTLKDSILAIIKDEQTPKFKQEVKKYPRTLDEKISNIFITVGIPAHIKGYQFLREAVKITIEQPEIISSITKRLYPDVAKHFETSASKVERSIRHAIEVAWNKGKIENINGLFGIHIYGNHEKPTNGEFIALVADKLLIEGA